MADIKKVWSQCLKCQLGGGCNIYKIFTYENACNPDHQVEAIVGLLIDKDSNCLIYKQLQEKLK